MARATAEDIFGPNGREDMRQNLMNVRDALADLKQAEQAGIDVSAQRAQLEEAAAQLRRIKDVYYPDLSIPA